MYTVGADLHKQSTLFYVLDEGGNKHDTQIISNSPDLLERYFMDIPKPFALAVETTYNWYFFVDIAERYAERVFLADSYALKAFAKRHKKTDKIDAKLIATLLYRGYLPTVTIADKATRNTRELLRYRINLVRDRTRLIARCKMLLDKLGLPPAGDLTTYKALDGIPYEHLPGSYGNIIAGYINSIRRLLGDIRDIELLIKKNSAQDADIVNLRTIPGLDYFSASVIKSEIIDIDRFPSFDRLCAYAGLAPRVAQSGSTTIHGRLNINRRKYLRWILLEVIWHFMRSSERWKSLYESLSKKKGFAIAKVIAARHMLKVIYHVLKERRPFYTENFIIRSAAAPALCGV